MQMEAKCNQEMEQLLEKQASELLKLDKKRKLVNDQYYKKNVLHRKTKEIHCNPLHILFRTHLPVNEICSFISGYLNLNYCSIHETIYPEEQCIGCYTNFDDMRDLMQDSWLWFKLHQVLLFNNEIIGFHSTKDYWLQEHLLKIIPDPELLWMSNLTKNLHLGIYPHEDEYLIVICDLNQDDDELQYVLTNDIDNFHVTTINFNL